MKFYDAFFEIARLKQFVVTMIIKVAVVALCFGLFSGSDSDIGVFGILFLACLLYTMISMYVGVSRAVGNWYIGIFVFIGLFVVMVLVMDKMPEFVSVLLLIAFFIGGPVLDISRIIRLIKLQKMQKEPDVSEVIIVEETVSAASNDSAE